MNTRSKHRVKAIMLAAGAGVRLGLPDSDACPKVLLRFGGKSLLRRHIEILMRLGVEELVLGVGYQQEKIAQEISSLGADDFVRTVYNADYSSGSIVTLWALREELRANESLLLMDADVLYDQRLLRRLIASPRENCVLLDRSNDLDEEQVKFCVRDGEIVEFRKWLSADGDFRAESVGMFKFSRSIARKLVSQTECYITQSRHDEPHEEAIRDVILTAGSGIFGYEDIAGLPWIEIDFMHDVDRAASEVLPRLDAASLDAEKIARPVFGPKFVQ